MSSVQEYMALNAPANLDMKKGAEFMRRISDIRSELAMIQKGLDEQAEVLRSVIEDFAYETDRRNERRQVPAALRQLVNYSKRLRKNI
ncbi:uncharacterized protein A1O5_12627 [Cladophialophora psammophila CBS 110553]|uniref:Uncharacterized protein n=1 Tax=Cladophialophora psammophila CBS 110553 TaxID=1182543 RepID=W9VTM4_9EURO|nr:uncharacterized protein A1O5_12627 [Cladophialophora psammophila CBS 110553]EXJ56360.1 hypothetical protein A1O5_12627 [Cladophialophora psammophila CBS 110553]